MLTRKRLLDVLIKHETLKVDDIANRKNLGFIPDQGQLNYLLGKLTSDGFLQILAGTETRTYTITEKTREEAERLKDWDITIVRKETRSIY